MKIKSSKKKDTPAPPVDIHREVAEIREALASISQTFDKAIEEIIKELRP